MISLLAKLLALPSGGVKLRMAALLPAMLVASVLELAGFGLLVTLLNSLLGAAPVAGGATGWASGLLQAMNAWTFAIAIVMFFAIKNMALLAIGYLTSRVANDGLSEFLSSLYARYLGQPYVAHLGRNSAEMINHLSTSAPIAFDSIRLMLELVMEVLLSVVTLGLLLSVKPGLTVISAVSLLTVGLIFHKVSSPIFRRWGAQGYGHELEALTVAKESLAAIKEVLVSGSQDHFVHRFRAEVHARGRLQSLASLNLSTARLFVETLMVVGIGGLVIWARETGQPTVETASIVSMFGIAAMRLMPSASRILSSLAELRRRTTVIEKLHAELHRPVQADPAPPAAAADGAEAAICLDDVHYRYPGSSADTLTGISVSIAHGQAVGLVGSSGAGKSTLVDVILGLLTATAGRVLVNGQPARHPAMALGVGYVPQHVAVLDDSIRRNVAFGLDDHVIDEPAVWRALGQAQLEEVVRAMPDGLDSRLGERGARLSGGQRQRIGIARALYGDPAILILDEATSALDSETEQAVVGAIDSLRGSKTLVIIAHRLSTVRHCDRLLFLADGAVADSGTFAELELRVPLFRAMVEKSMLTPAGDARK
ncbi:MAG: ABC transporter ATP-binding protein [Phaeospirillum sp.]|nr:ABC transporter ATP-binding protein [Phaeospirillum sp.]